MKNINSNVSNKKNAGKGNGNSIIHKSTDYNSNDYVSGDETPTSAGHKFSKNTQNIDDKLK